MNDRQARALLMPYLDSELDARTTAEIAAHLEASASTRERFDSEAQLESWIADSLRGEEMPGDVWHSIQLRMGVVKPPLWPRFAAAAAVLIAAAVGWFFATWESNELLRTFASMHQMVAQGDAGFAPETSTAKELRTYMNERGYHALKVLQPRTFKGHPIEIVGARDEVILGAAGVNMLFRCCDDLVSVFVMPAALASSLPVELQPLEGEATKGRTGDLDVETLDRDEFVLTVMSDGSDEHKAVIAAML